MVGAVAGGVSTLAHDLVMVPADTIKQRRWLSYYRSAFHCLSRMLATGGGSLYRSLPTTLAMNVPYASLMMMANEGARKVVNPSGEYSLTTFLLCGGFSGAFAAALTTPLDVVKTRLQTQGLGVGVEAAAEAAAHDAPSAFTVRYSGFVDAATALWRCDGLRGFFRGATPRGLDVWSGVRHLVGRLRGCQEGDRRRRILRHNIFYRSDSRPSKPAKGNLSPT